MGRPTACRLCGRDLGPRRRSGSSAYCKRCIAKADREIVRKPRVDCRECGKTFSTKTRSVHYCSDACRTVSARRANTENQRRYEADPEKRALKRARARLAAAARRARARGDKQSPRANRDVKGLKPNPKSAEPYACALCGRDFVPYGGGRPAYCKRCAAKADKEIGRKRTLNCKECGTRFSTPNRSVCYCSPKCRAAGRMHSSNASARRSMAADPEARALASARQRAWIAARRAKEKGRGGG